MDILIKNLEIPKEKYIRVEIHHDGTMYVQKNGYYSFYVKSQDKAVALPPHGRLVSAEDFIDSFEDIINECRRQLSEKGEDITVLNYFHDTIVELIGYMPTVLEANNGTDN